MELKIYVIKKNLVKNYTTSTSSFRPEKEPKSWNRLLLCVSLNNMFWKAVTAHPHSQGTWATGPNAFNIANSTFVLLVLDFAANNPPAVAICRCLNQSPHKFVLPPQYCRTILQFIRRNHWLSTNSQPNLHWNIMSGGYSVSFLLEKQKNQSTRKSVTPQTAKIKEITWLGQWSEIHESSTEGSLWPKLVWSSIAWL